MSMTWTTDGATADAKRPPRGWKGSAGIPLFASSIKMLARHGLIGGDEENVIEADAVWSCVIMRELEVVEVEDEGLAAAGGHPEGEFTDIVLIVEEVHACMLLLDEIIRVLVKFIEKLLRALEIPVKEDFGVEHCEVLEVCEGYGGIPVPVNPLHIAPDAGVIGFEVCPDPGIEPVPRDQSMEEIALALFIIPFLHIRLGAPASRRSSFC